MKLILYPNNLLGFFFIIMDFYYYLLFIIILLLWIFIIMDYYGFIIMDLDVNGYKIELLNETHSDPCSTCGSYH